MKKRIGPLEISIIVVVLFVLVCGVMQITSWLKHKPAPPTTELVIGNNQSYYMLGFHAVVTSDNTSKRYPGYLFTLVLPNEYERNISGKALAELRRGTIIVPKDGLAIDRSLPKNTIKWFELKTVEGKNYAVAHWNPAVIRPVDYIPAIRQEKPLTHPKR